MLPWCYVERTGSSLGARAQAKELLKENPNAASVCLVASEFSEGWRDAVVQWAYSSLPKKEVGCFVELFWFEEVHGDFALKLPHFVIKGQALEDFFKNRGGVQQALLHAPVIFSSDTQARALGARPGEFVACMRLAADLETWEQHVMVVRNLDETGALLEEDEEDEEEEEEEEQEQEEEEAGEERHVEEDKDDDEEEEEEEENEE